jgi:carbonic anhydrase
MPWTENSDPRPRRQLVIVTCMDARIDPLALFGLEIGDAHVLRNAGGLITSDVLRSLAISQAALGTTKVWVVHHTLCGMLGTEEELMARLHDRAGAAPPGPLGAFTDFDEQARQSAKAIHNCSFLAHKDDVEVHIVDVVDGSLRQVV